MTGKFLIKHPIISEKATRGSVLGKYMFLVADQATKNEIKKAIQTIYSVEVTDVHTVNTKPKSRRLGRSIGIKPGYKKAIVTLKQGQKLDILPQ